jgi:hypothetical protein
VDTCSTAEATHSAGYAHTHIACNACKCLSAWSTELVFCIAVVNRQVTQYTLLATASCRYLGAAAGGGGMGADEAGGGGDIDLGTLEALLEQVSLLITMEQLYLSPFTAQQKCSSRLHALVHVTRGDHVFDATLPLHMCAWRYSLLLYACMCVSSARSTRQRAGVCRVRWG